MFSFIFKIFGFLTNAIGVLRNTKVGNSVVYWIIGMIFIWVGYVFYTIDRDNRVAHSMVDEYKQRVETLEKDNRYFFEISQINAEAFNELKKYQDRLFEELDKVTQARIKLNKDLQDIKERTKNDEDGDIAPVLLNTIRGLHGEETRSIDSNKSRKK